MLKMYLLRVQLVVGRVLIVYFLGFFPFLEQGINIILKYSYPF